MAEYQGDIGRGACKRIRSGVIKLMKLSKLWLRRKAIEASYKFGFTKGRYEQPGDLSKKIRDAIEKKEGFALARLGLSEINGFFHYNGDRHPSYLNLDSNHIEKSMAVNLGFFPNDEQMMRDWAASYSKEMSSVDAFAVYFNIAEAYFLRKYMQGAFVMSNSDVVHPMFDGMNWFTAIEGKRVAVITSSANTILAQLENNPNFLGSLYRIPSASYRIIKAPFSPLIDPSNQAKSSKHEMKRLKVELEQSGCDILLAAAGGYSNPLVVYAKNLGIVGINMGGAIDPLFGIRTKRYVEQSAKIRAMMDASWISPLDSDKPQGAGTIEGGCYW